MRIDQTAAANRRKPRFPAATWLLALCIVSSGPRSAAAGEQTVSVKSAEGVASPSARSTSQAQRRAVDCLWRLQSEDGGWHSETYAVMRSGQALTPFVLHALLDAGAQRDDPRVALALRFIRSNVNRDGALGLCDADILEYPVYSTAYALRCLVRAGDVQDAELLARMADWLASMQFRRAAGFSGDQSVFGGWGFGGPRSPQKPGHMDLAHTRRALDALACVGRLDSQAQRDALVFLGRMQRLPRSADGTLSTGDAGAALAPFDGGFYFSPVVLAANKGQEPGDPVSVSRSYATATCDGALALLAAGCRRDDPRLAAARQWLIDRPRWEYPEGVPAQGNPWADAVYFYHLAVRAEASARLDLSGAWRGRAAAILLAEQRPDGSFCNLKSSLMKEDDPLLATALAVIALTHVQR